MTAQTRGRGRPQVGERVAARLPAELLNDVDAEASTEGMTRAEMVRVLLTEAIEHRRNPAV